MASIEINTNVGCKLACTFCPQDKLVKSYKTKGTKELTYEDYEKYLAKIPPHVRIDFSGMTEPFLNPLSSKMINHTFEKGYSVAIYTTLTGLKPIDASQILEKWSHQISENTPWVIHLPDKENNMRGWKKTDEYLETLNCFIEHKKKYPNEFLKFMTMNKDGNVNNEIKDIFDQSLPNFFAGSRAENLNRDKVDNVIVEKSVRHSNPVVCRSTPFFDHNNLFPNGDVVLCCMDYSMDYVIGNLKDQDYYEIFSGKKLADIRNKAMMVGYDKNFICKNCTNACELKKNNSEGWKLTDNVYWQSDKEVEKNKYLYNENINLKKKLKEKKSVLSYFKI